MTPGEKSLLRFVTTGSVDDGKSTLIGRLLYETRSIFDDQYDAIKKTSVTKGYSRVDLALLLDGLSAEREQGITIDVAYRYFETQKRKFIIADSPGHVQYTRNMITGASTADLAVILIDARNGVLVQSKRHAFIVSLMHIPHLIVVVNKMDLVDYSEAVYNEIVEQYSLFSEKLDIHDLTFIPVSAIDGDNVVEKSNRMPWYTGPTLLHYLEEIRVTSNRNLIDFRFPVQYVIRPHLDFRGFAGRISSGTISPGEEIVALPSGQAAKVKSILTYDGELAEAFASQSVVVTLDKELDISRGDMVVRKNNIPMVSNLFDAMICWMDDHQLELDHSYILKHTTRSVKAFITRVVYKVDVNTLHRASTNTLSFNEIGRIEIRTSSPIFFDPYKMNHATGAFILVDHLTNHTVAAGMIRGATRTINDVIKEYSAVPLPQEKSPHTIWTGWNIGREERERRNGHKAAVLWLTGYSGAGKSTIAKSLEKRLFDLGCQTVLLDGDNVRHGLCSDLGFSDRDRSENIRRVGEATKLFFENGSIVMCAFISPFEKDRAFVRALIERGRFFEIYVKCDLSVCKERDPNGLYKRALSGQIVEFTGVSSAYEEPRNPELVVETVLYSTEVVAENILNMLKQNEII